MSKARSPRAVCSITIGISGFIDAPDAVLPAFSLTPAGRGAHFSLYPGAARVRRGCHDCLDENVRRLCGHREFNSIRRADPESRATPKRAAAPALLPRARKELSDNS